jgi:hypothetical protein
MGADHDDAHDDCNSWLLWLENEAALMGCCEWMKRAGTSCARSCICHVETTVAASSSILTRQWFARFLASLQRTLARSAPKYSCSSSLLLAEKH